MSRFTDNWDGDYENAVLDQGRWEHNSRAALKGKRGRQALCDLRDALLALPEKRLIDGAVCTVGGVDKRLPVMTEDEMRREVGDLADLAHLDAGWYREHMASMRQQERRELAEVIDRQGEGVCAIGAFLWHQKVKAGMDPEEAFGSLPTVFSAEEDNPLDRTARLGKDAGLTFTLAWNLAYRNDETFRRMTPEERYTAFLAWIDQELAEGAAA